MRIGILTGGGDVPGLNSCIKAVVEQCDARGWSTVGFRRGWAGPLHYNPGDTATHDNAVALDRPGVRVIDRSGGTVLHTSRTNPGAVSEADLPDFLKSSTAIDENGKADCTPHVLRVLDDLGIDAMVPIGGDDTLSYAARLHREGVKIAACPKTMDNDVFGTDYCIGFSTAVSRSVEFINALRTPTGSHERIAVIELFGRNSGETALVSGYLADADRVLISEVPFDIGRLAELIVKDKRDNPSSYAVVVVSEGAVMQGGGVLERNGTDAYGHRKLGGIGELVGDELKRLTGEDIIGQSLAYLMRAGPPDALDRMVATAYGTMAVQMLADGQSGLMMALHGGRYAAVPVDICVSGTKRVDVAQLYDAAAYRPTVKRILDTPMFLY
ncbi:MAG: ATP-dependent 6-phosphofructokinase [Alphaproteobacteria bacterium]|nr:ATP-dependent 6-phosphofructokinase [Alphaproteobacteria bacterium]